MIFFFHWSFIDQTLNTPTLVIICSLLLFCVTGWKTWTSRYDPPAFILLPNYTRPQNIVEVEPYFVSNLSDYVIKKSLTSSWRETEIQVTLRWRGSGRGGGVCISTNCWSTRTLAPLLYRVRQVAIKQVAMTLPHLLQSDGDVRRRLSFRGHDLHVRRLHHVDSVGCRHIGWVHVMS